MMNLEKGGEIPEKDREFKFPKEAPEVKGKEEKYREKIKEDTISYVKNTLKELKALPEAERQYLEESTWHRLRARIDRNLGLDPSEISFIRKKKINRGLATIESLGELQEDLGKDFVEKKLKEVMKVAEDGMEVSDMSAADHDATKTIYPISKEVGTAAYKKLHEMNPKEAEEHLRQLRG